MNKYFPYEEALKDKLQNLPLPNEDTAWADMERRLDKKDDDGIILVPLKFGCGIWALLGSLGIVLVILYFISRSDWNKKELSGGTKPNAEITDEIKDTFTNNLREDTLIVDSAFIGKKNRIETTRINPNSTDSIPGKPANNQGNQPLPVKQKSGTKNVLKTKRLNTASFNDTEKEKILAEDALKIKQVNEEDKRNQAGEKGTDNNLKNKPDSINEKKHLIDEKESEPKIETQIKDSSIQNIAVISLKKIKERKQKKEKRATGVFFHRCFFMAGYEFW